jgi:hypothetical protein
MPTSYADCLKIWEPQLPGTLRDVEACNGIALPFVLPLPINYSLSQYTILMRTLKSAVKFTCLVNICCVTVVML